MSFYCREKEGFPITAIREIKILQKLRHPNIVSLLDVVTGTDSFSEPRNSGTYLVFEYLDHDLSGLRELELSMAQIKYYLKQILEGIYFMHRCKVMHRDIKGANILIGQNHEVKLADFGLSRSVLDQNPLYTNRVVTLWYRAPELLLGSYKYTEAIDIWSIGCVFAEMLTGKPLCPGGSMELSQIQTTFQVCGTPTVEDWPGVVNLPWWDKFKPTSKCQRIISEEFKKFLPVAGLDLLNRLLTLDPSKRITAEEALSHPYFYLEEPALCLPSSFPKYEENFHEFATKKRRQETERQLEKEKFLEKEKKLQRRKSTNSASQTSHI